MKKNISYNIIKNNKGLGLIAAMIAAAMVIIVALTVANFVGDQNRQNKRLEIKGNCEVIANSIVEHIKKDENSLYITSFSADPNVNRTAYPSNLDSTDDGLDRFRFGAAAVSVFRPKATPLLNQSTNPPTLNWDYYNHFNIKNSSNRLTMLAADGFCCGTLNMDSCTKRFESPGFTISEPNTEAYLGINISNPAGGSLCSGGTLSSPNIINSKYNSPIDFRVRIVMHKGTSNERTCEAAGRVQRKLDTQNSLTLIEYQNTLCSSSGIPSLCGAASTVNLRVKTVRNSAGTQCEDNCLKQLRSRTCTDISANGGLSLFNSFASCSAQCENTEPGSNFLCKIGTKGWFANPASTNAWEPCESATVKNDSGFAIAATVRISYDGTTTKNKSPQQTTNATITMTGLPQGEYLADVRAVDTAGNVGRSFCSYSDSCDSSSEPHFTIVTTPPTVGPLIDGSNFVKPIAATGAAPVNHQGRVYSLTNLAKYNTQAFSGITNRSYQCANGAPIFQATTTATGNSCTATYINASGTTSNPTCTCTSGVCTTYPPSSNVNGSYSLRMRVSNACGSTNNATDATLAWCSDSNNAIGINTTPLADQGPNPNISSLINSFPTTNSTGTKACGVISLCPNISGTFSPSMRINNAGGSCTTPSDWFANTHSGCIRDPSNNLCITVVDPCGRYQNTTTTAPSATGQYSSFLNVSAVTANECYSRAGNPVGGNFCAPGVSGGICTNSGKCIPESSCTKYNSACSNDEQCSDSNLGASYLDPDGPKCVSGRCTCGTNKETSVTANCRAQYCPELNSCPINIGSVPAGGACTPCNHWTVGAWSACSGSTQTRSVTCVGNCSCYPRPTDTQACVSCGTASGGTFATAPTTNLCASGTASAVTQVGSNWNWTCTDGATPINCSAAVGENGTCGPANGNHYANSAAANAAGLCATGTAVPASVSGAGPWNWVCNGTPPGTNQNCSTTPGGGGLGCCENYNGFGWRTVYFAGTLAECESMRDRGLAVPGNTCVGGSYQSPPPMGCAGREFVLVNSGEPFVPDKPAPQCIPYELNPGVCGPADGNLVSSAPTSNLCTVGTESTVTGSGPWSWTCVTPDGDDSCSANVLTTPTDGVWTPIPYGSLGGLPYCGSLYGKADRYDPTGKPCTKPNGCRFKSIDKDNKFENYYDLECK